MPTRLPPGDPRSWNAQRERMLHALSPATQELVALAKFARVFVRERERLNALLLLGRTLGPFPEITMIDGRRYHYLRERLPSPSWPTAS